MKLEEQLKLGIKNSAKVADNYQYCKYHGYNALLENKRSVYKIKVEMEDGTHWTLEKNDYIFMEINTDYLTEESIENIEHRFKHVFMPLEVLKEVTEEVNNSRFYYSNFEGRPINCQKIKNIYLILGSC